MTPDQQIRIRALEMAMAMEYVDDMGCARHYGPRDIIAIAANAEAFIRDGAQPDEATATPDPVAVVSDAFKVWAAETLAQIKEAEVVSNVHPLLFLRPILERAAQ